MRFHLKKYLVFMWAPLALAFITAGAVIGLTGSTYTTAPNQDAIMVRFLWAYSFPVLMLVFPVLTCIFAPQRKGLMCVAALAVVVISSVINYKLL